MRECFGVGEIVHRDKVEVGDTFILRRAHDLAANPSKSVDADPCCHSINSVRLEPVTTGVGPAESHIADYPCTRFVQHLRARVERRGGGHYIIDDHDMRPAQSFELSIIPAK